MKKTILPLFIAAFMLLTFQTVRAQTPTSYQNSTSYRVAAGLKFSGYENGITGKYFLDRGTAIEGLLGIRSHGLVVTGLYELHQTAFNVPELKLYYGFGAHLGAVGSGYYRKFTGDSEYYNNDHLLLGADGVLGLEYMIPDSPIAISVDLNPRLELATGPFFDLAPGLGIKYTFK